MRFKLLMSLAIFQVLLGTGFSIKFEKEGEDWNALFWNTEKGSIDDFQSRTDRHEESFYENYGYNLVREKRIIGMGNSKGSSFAINAVRENIDGNPEMAGIPEVSGVPEVDAQAECAARVCDVAQCECVDNWDMFSQTCNLLEKKFCSKK